MDQKVYDIAERLFRSKYEELTELERHVAHHITERTPISTNIVQDYSEQMTLGQKLADKVASFGGILGIYLHICVCDGYMDSSEFVYPSQTEQLI